MKLPPTFPQRKSFGNVCKKLPVVMQQHSGAKAQTVFDVRTMFAQKSASVFATATVTVGPDEFL
jgi:hypothetical protein